MNQTPILNPKRNPRFKDLSGMVFGKLTVLPVYDIIRDKNGCSKVYWDCKCDCGKLHTTYAGNLISGGSKSCGCVWVPILKNMSTTHSMSRTRQYRIWKGMKQRCSNLKDRRYCDYGGRGIIVCSEWDTFDGFWNDMKYGYSEELSIDRVDNDKGYCKENCRWSTVAQQCINKRNTVHLQYNGNTRTQAQWAEETGIHQTTIASRLKLGWTVEEALTTPPGGKRKCSETSL
jgi:hypothetical protein